MIPNEQLSLWSRIQQFKLDDETAARPFSDKLTSEQNWTPAFTKRAIAEYRRFLFLCCISPNGAAPSQPVDEVWHLHLTYTKSYWVDLCQGALGRELHHFPSAGGQQEDAKHRQWYSDTLALYRSTFDEEPPADIWPSVVSKVDAPDIPPFQWKSAEGAGIAAVMVMPFLFIRIAYDTFSPFALGGPHFLVFFGVFFVALAASLFLIRWSVRRALLSRIAEGFPSDATPFQVADCLYGKHRALQAGILDLLQRNLLEVSESRQFRVKNYSFTPLDGETNPLIPAWAEEADGSLHSYDYIAGNWYARERFSHPALTALSDLAKRQEPFWQSGIFIMVYFGMAVVRIAQGFLNGRPVTFLLFETLAGAILGTAIWKGLSPRWMIVSQIKEMYEGRLPEYGDRDRTVPLFVLEGNSAIAGFAEGALLVGLFAAARPAGGDGGLWIDSGGSSDNGGGSCGSSCGSSGCGGCSGN